MFDQFSRWEHKLTEAVIIMGIHCCHYRRSVLWNVLSNNVFLCPPTNSSQLLKMVSASISNTLIRTNLSLIHLYECLALQSVYHTLYWLPTCPGGLVELHVLPRNSRFCQDVGPVVLYSFRWPESHPGFLGHDRRHCSPSRVFCSCCCVPMSDNQQSLDSYWTRKMCQH